MPVIKPIGPSLGLGEGPYWDEESQTLYLVDIYAHSLHSYKPQKKEFYSVSVECDGQPVSLVIKMKNEKNKFLISVKNSLATVLWDGVSSQPLVPKYILDIESKHEITRINDGKCDPSNRLWAGTMGPQIAGTQGQFVPEKGSLYSIKPGKKVEKHQSKIGISNGLAWSLDKSKFYYIDSLKLRVDSYDYDDATGALSNEKTVFCFKKNNIEGFPDGMTIDAEGMLWVAVYLGAQILRIDPNSGEVKQKIQFPSLQITSAAFGGPNLEDLYVTSAKVGFTEEMEAKYPQAGKTFRVTGLGIKGTSSVPVVL